MSINSARSIDNYAIRTPENDLLPHIDANRGDAIDVRSIRGKDVLVFVSVGQSNAANMAIGYEYQSTNPGKVFCLSPVDGGLYRYESGALAGATGASGNWMLGMADHLIDNGVYEMVVFVGFTAVGGVSIENFAPGIWGNAGADLSFLKHRLMTAGYRLRDLGLRPSCWNFALGESASGYPEQSFRAPLDKVVAYSRSNGFMEPWIMDITTLHAGIINDGAREALNHIVNGIDILRGVDTDDLGFPDYRLDEKNMRVHLNELGCQQKALRKYMNIASLKPLLPSAFL